MPEDVPEPEFQVTTAEHYKALAHPLRQRLLFRLGEPATTSQLAAALRTNKGNIAYHLGVLRDAGLVTPAGARQVRGGTEQYYQRVARIISFADHHPQADLPASFRAVADEIAAAEPGPFLVLRHIRLTPAQAEQVTATLAALVGQAEDADPGQPRYGMLLGLYRQRPDQAPGSPAAGDLRR